MRPPTQQRRFYAIEGGKERPTRVRQPRNRRPIWQWLTLTGQLLMLTVGTFLATVVVSMALAIALRS